MAVLMEWDDSYGVGVKEIDEQHKKLFAHINDLYSAMKKGQDGKILGQLLDGLAAYVDYHFGAEEKYFEKFDYKEKDEHIARHRQYADKIRSFQDDYARNKAFLSYEIIDFLEDWILGHVTGEDRKYTKCFNNHGVY